MRTLFFIITTILCVSHSPFSEAHAEKGKPRFVANGGEDTGKCDNRFRPCRTIAYAALQAHKGDRILVAKGSYNTGLEYLISELVPVYGGYNQLDNFQQQSPDQHPTYLTGVPAEFAEKLNNKGFNVIRDNKQLASPALKKNLASLAQLKQVQKSQTCVDGSAGQFACSNLSLVGHLPLSSFSGGSNGATDIWGHIDLNTGKEYAIMGLQRGTAVIDISEPSSPQVVGVISGQSSGWRDIKVYQFYQDSSQSWRAYAYVTTDNVSNEGVAIIDLNKLAQNTVELVVKQKINNGAHNVYISGVDYSLNIPIPGQIPLVHILGADRNGGAMRSYNLDNPELLSSEFDAAGSNSADYTHDATSLFIDDARMNQCPNATAQGCMVMVDYNEQEVRFWDQSAPDTRAALSAVTYNQSAYVHSGWWSEDKQYIFVHDEGDEQNFNVNTTVQIFEISDLTAPRYVTAWRGPTAAIDHNGFVRGNRYYMSNYTRGLTVLDISNPEQPTEAGFFDTYPSSNNNSFNGAWGTYPYLPSGLILVSDISSGLYILEDHTNDSNFNTVGFASTGFSGSEGSSTRIEVSRQGATTDAVTVSYQTLPGSASSEDFEAVSGTLQWAAGDSNSQFIDITVTPDQNDNEFDEQFFVRLFDPKNNTTLSKTNMTTVTISGRQNNGLAAFNDTQLTLLETQTSAEVMVNRNSGANGQLVINYTLVDGTGMVTEDIESASGQLTWEDGDRAAKFITLVPIDDGLTESDETLVLRLSSDGEQQIGSPNEIQILIRDDESNTAPSANAGADAQYNVRQSVALDGTAQDSEGSTLTYAWSQVSGSSVTLAGADTLNASFVAPSSAGDLEFSLTVTDEFGAATSDNITVTVVATTTPTAPTNGSSSGSGGTIHWFAIGALVLCLLRRRKHVK